MSSILNFNIGVLGHVDSGKTSLAKSLSTIASTAAFDKNPQSKERGITLDLGFSSFVSESPPHLSEAFTQVQYTLVDCPGHASLIKTVIGGAQIIDLMFLVIDAAKGMQTQTAECLILGEITCSKMIVILNKIDVFLPEVRDKSIEKITKKMRATLSKTKFKDAPIVPIAARPMSVDEKELQPLGLDDLLDTLKKMTFLPERSGQGNLLFAVDHCFSIRGQGTVMTGTILQGAITVNDNIEISSLKEVRKVKSIQMFKKSVPKAIQGDRVGVCVTQFDSGLLERGLVSTPGSLPCVFAVIIKLNRIPYFKGNISTKGKFHISMGYETVLATLTLFGSHSKAQEDSTFNFDKEFFFVETIPSKLEGENENTNNNFEYYSLLEFDKPIVISPKSKVLGCKLDQDIHSNSCRLAFEGKTVHYYEKKENMSKELTQLRIFKNKEKKGTVERLNNEFEIIAKNMFKKETNIQCFVGLKISLSTGEEGLLDGTFGQSGKFKIRFMESLKPTTLEKFDQKKKTPTEPIIVTLAFKRYIFDKSMAQ